MCAFNDYTPTELGSNDCETRDAWIGTGWSTDGGFTWHNALLPGYPQDTTPEGFASSLRGFSTGADPTIRSGKNGKMYLLGIAFNRPGQASCVSPSTGTQGGGVVFIQTYVNKNNVENNPNPFQPVGQPFILDQGNTGTVFQDKPWVAVGPDGAIHVAYATFVGGSKPISTIWYQTSKDGVNWTKSKLSEGDKVSNGTTIVVHPTTGWVDITWRRRQSSLSNQIDAIQFVRSTDGGRSFTSPTTIVSLPNLMRTDGTLVSRPFDQGSAPYAFRNISNPAITADNFGRSYVAWSERSEHTVNGILRRDALIKMVVGTAAKANGNQVNWTTPFAVDPLPPTNFELDRGQQLRPALWFANGQLMLSYMHTRDDDRLSVFTRNDIPDPGKSVGNIARYVESFIYKGDLPSKPFKMFNDFIFDIGPTSSLEGADVDPFKTTSPILRRHTEDVMALMLTPAPADAVFPNVLPSLNGKTKVSRYAMVLVPKGDGTFQLQQGQVNVLGRPLHCSDANGAPQCAFAGDYDDVVGPAWKADGNGNIVPNTDPATAVSFLVSWTDNRDLFPSSLTNNFSRVGPNCTDAHATGTRNQNPYIARVGTGLFVFSFGNQRPLNMTFKRAFNVVFQNAVNATKTYLATIANPTLSGTGSASWDQFSSQKPTLTLSIGPFSSASRALYALSSDATAPITVNVQELDTSGNPILGGLQSTIVLNPDRSTPNLTSPNPGPNVNGTDPALAEVYIPDAAAPDAAAPDAAANVVRTPDAAAPDAAAPDAAAPDAAAVPPQYPDAAAPDAAAPDAAASPTMTPDAASPDAAAVPPGGVITDTIYKFTNKSNVSAAFGVKTFTTQPLCTNCKLQILVMKPSSTPTQRGCDPKNQDTAALVANIPSPDLITDPNQLTFSPTDASVKNLTLAVPPGGQLSVIYRLFDPSGGGTCPGFQSTGCIDSFGRKRAVNPTFNPATDLIPVTIAQSVSTNCTVNCSSGNTSVPLIITTASPLAGGTYGTPYSASLSSLGGDGGPYHYSLIGVTPTAPWLAVSDAGAIFGTPTAVGTFSVMVQATDGASHTTTKTLSLFIAKANATISVTPYNVTYNGSPHTATGTAIGAFGESLAGLDLSGTTHTTAGDYPADPWTFTDVTGNYNNTSGTVHDRIRRDGILVYGPALASVTPNEATLASAAGHNVVTKTAAEWATLSTSDFASFSAIVFPDPNCAFDSPTPTLDSAVNTRTTWSPAVTGPKVVLGTDPVFHNSLSAAQTLMVNGINFAASGPTTGMYMSLSCYYHAAAPDTVVTVLDQFGTFKVNGGDLSNVHIVDTGHPVMAGLTDATMSGWGNSMHEWFSVTNGVGAGVGFPATWKELARENSGGAVRPYIIVNNGTLLVYGPALASDVTPNEATLASAAGYNVVTKTAAEWATLSTSDFASFGAIVFPDPNCAFQSGPSPTLDSAVNTRTKWSPAVTGPKVVVGTDPVFHNSLSAAQTLMINGIKFAASGPTTGMYMSLSCYYHAAAPDTVVTVLDQFGTFKVNGGDLSNVNIVDPGHPVMTGLTDATMSGWGNSMHEWFSVTNGVGAGVGFPATWKELARENSGGAVRPYIIADR